MSPLKKNVNGILNVNKPSGCTSFDIVARIKRCSKQKRVGHAGTLDPMASGVLPVCLGQATRVVEYLMDATKTYRAEIELGVTTDTFDAQGKVIRRSDASNITIQDVEEVLNRPRLLIVPLNISVNRFTIGLVKALLSRKAVALLKSIKSISWIGSRLYLLSR